jgi:hypothetical protein
LPSPEISKIKINKEADIHDEVFSDASISPEKADPAGRKTKRSLGEW